MLVILTGRYMCVLSKVQGWCARPHRTHAQMLLFMLGTILLTAGMFAEAHAQAGTHGIKYNGDRIDAATVAVLTYLEGSFGALIMVCAGIGSILSAAFGQYRASLSLMVVAIGSFILRSFVHTFFNTTGISGISQ